MAVGAVAAPRRMIYRYKRPPRKRKPVAIQAPAVVTTKSSRHLSLGGRVAAEVDAGHPSRGEAAQPSTPRAAARVAPPANDDRKPSIVTTTSRKRSKLLRADKRAAKPDDDPEATARVKAFFARMIRPGGALPPEKP
jgi:hypothetical protein